MTNKIFVPGYTNECVVIQNNGVVRAYETTPTYNSDVAYKDYYTSMNYNYNEGIAHFSNYSNLPTCRLGTSNPMYRVDINNTIGLIIIALILIVNLVYDHLKESFK